MSPPPLSVAMAVHNGMPFVEESVRTILGQTFADFELVIGDDGSDDGTNEVLRALAAADGRIRLLRREAKSGLAASGNWVVGEAAAPLVAIAHADDVSRPARLERQMEVFGNHSDAVLVGTLCGGIDEAGRRVQPPAAWRLRSKAPFAPFPHSSIMFRKAAFDAVGGYRADAEYWEDFDLYLRLAEVGRVFVVAEELASVRHTSTSTRLRNDEQRVLSAVDRMYRAAEAYARGEQHEAFLTGDRSGKLLPRSFVARGSIRLWSGRSPGVLKSLLRDGELRLDLGSLQALVWAAWGEISPGSLRFFIRSLLRLRNFVVRPSLVGKRVVEWRPRARRAG